MEPFIIICYKQNQVANKKQNRNKWSMSKNLSQYLLQKKIGLTVMGRNMNRSSDVFLFRKFSMRNKYLHCWLTSFVFSLLRTFSVPSKTCSHHPGPLHFISINIGLEKLGSKWSGQIKNEDIFAKWGVRQYWPWLLSEAPK